MPETGGRGGGMGTENGEMGEKNRTIFQGSTEVIQISLLFPTMEPTPTGI